MKSFDLKSEKDRGYIGSFLGFAIFCMLPLSFFFFFYQQTLGRAQICLTVQQILEHSIKGNAINLARNISIFLVANHYVME